MSLRDEFPIGSVVYDHGGTKLFVIGYLDDDPDSIWASPIRPEDDAELAWRLRAGVASGHARFFREHFTDRAAA